MQPYFERDGIQIWLGDCREVLPTLTEPVDLVLTDPPYSSVTHEGARSVTSTRTLVTFDSITADELREVISDAALKCRGWFVATMDWKHIAALEQHPPSGWRFVRFGIWVKPNGAPQFTGDRPAMGWEGVCIMHRDDRRMAWNGGGHHAVWTQPKIDGEHPTEKPITLIRKWVRLFSNPGDLVFDPYGGAGTTARACLDLGRRCVMVEKEEKYAEIAARRLQQAVLPLGDIA